MRNKEAALLILLLGLCVQGLDLDVNVDSVIKGTSTFLDYSPEVLERPQRFLISWENQGSVSCRTRMRVDVLNETSLVYTAWSEESPLEPGDYAALEARYFPLHSGNYSAKVYVYHCNRIDEVEQIGFSAEVVEEYDYYTVEGPSGNETRSIRRERSMNETPITIDSKNTPKKVEFTIESSQEVRDLVIMPREYPVGWIFESGKIDLVSPEAPKTLEIGYEPSIWKPSEIVFDVATGDGSIHATYRMRLEEEQETQGLEQYMVPFLAAAVLVLSILLMNEKRKK